MSDREIVEFTLDRTDAISETILDLAKEIAGYRGENRGAVERMSYVAMKLEERDQDHETRLRKLESRVVWVSGAAAGVGLVLGLLVKFAVGG